MPMTSAERAKKYRDGKRDGASRRCERDAAAYHAAERTHTESQRAIGPLDVYSAHRWEYLQGRGYEWNADKQRGTRPRGGYNSCTEVGVTVPGDPAYDGIVGKSFSPKNSQNSGELR